MRKNATDPDEAYLDGVGLMRCGACLRPLVDHAGEMLVTLRAKDLTEVLNALNTATVLARRLMETFEADLAER